MLLRIRDFIQDQGVVSTQQLSREFHLDHLALQPMLDVWVRKGIIKKCQDEPQCQSTCIKCKIHTVDYYQSII